MLLSLLVGNVNDDHLVSTKHLPFVLPKWLTRSPVASILSPKYQLGRCVENALRSDAVIV